MNRSQKAMIAKIMFAKQDQYKKYELIKTFSIAASALGFDNNYQGLLDLTNKMMSLVGESAEILPDVDGLVGLTGTQGTNEDEVLTAEIPPNVVGITGIQGSKDTRTPAEKRKDTIARKKAEAELAEAKQDPKDVLAVLDKQFG